MKTGVYKTILKLTGCAAEEFTCESGECVSMQKRCNQILDCRDKTDEKACGMVVLPKSYTKNTPPISTTETGGMIPVSVNISMDFLKMVKIVESDNKIFIQFTIYLEWIENRATFQNLKDEKSLNILGEDIVHQLWYPYVIYDNTDMKDAVTLEDGLLTTVLVSKQGKFTRSDPTFLDEVEIFQGSENQITLSQTYTKTFQCKYLLHKYPFDTQV